MTDRANSYHEISKKILNLGGQDYEYYDLSSLEREGFDIRHLPFSIKVLLESVLRQWDGHVITEDHIRSLADWTRTRGSEEGFYGSTSRT